MTKKTLFHILAVLVVIALPAAQTYGRAALDGEGTPGIQPDNAPLGVEYKDNFDSYADGSQVAGQGDWQGWDGSAAAGALVSSAFSLSAPHSVDIVGASDLVHQFAGYTSGQWVFTAWQYVPSGTTNGPTFFILLNTYTDFGPYNWSLQVQMDDTTGMVTDFDGGSMLPLVTDAWAEIRVEIDLDANTQDVYYDGALLFSDSWTEHASGGGVLNIAAVDLFANAASSVYYDDVSLCPAPGCAPDEPPVPIVEVPTLSGSGLLALVVIIALAGGLLIRRRFLP